MSTLLARGLVVLALGAGFGCASHHPSGRQPAVSSSAMPDPAASALAERATAAIGTAFQAVFGARTTDGQAATVTVFVGGRGRYRVDVAQAGSTASLYGTAEGSVACTARPGTATTCFLVAAPGKPVPARFDAGLQRVFTADLPVLSQHADAFVVRPGPDLQPEATLAAARCFTLTAVRPDGPASAQQAAGEVDLGTYCLTAAGLPRRLTFTSGTLTLRSVGPPPTLAQLTPPAPAEPLPRSATAAPSQ